MMHMNTPGITIPDGAAPRRSLWGPAPSAPSRTVALTPPPDLRRGGLCPLAGMIRPPRPGSGLRAHPSASVLRCRSRHGISRRRATRALALHPSLTSSLTKDRIMSDTHSPTPRTPLPYRTSRSPTNTSTSAPTPASLPSTSMCAAHAHRSNSTRCDPRASTPTTRPSRWSRSQRSTARSPATTMTPPTSCPPLRRRLRSHVGRRRRRPRRRSRRSRRSRFEDGSKIAFWLIELLREVWGRGIGSAAYALVERTARAHGRTVLQSWAEHPAAPGPRHRAAHRVRRDPRGPRGAVLPAARLLARAGRAQQRLRPHRLVRRRGAPARRGGRPPRPATAWCSGSPRLRRSSSTATRG